MVILTPFNVSRLLFSKPVALSIRLLPALGRTLGLLCFLCSAAPSVHNTHRSNFSCLLHPTIDPRSREALPTSVLLSTIHSLVSFRSLDRYRLHTTVFIRNSAACSPARLAPHVYYSLMMYLILLPVLIPKYNSYSLLKVTTCECLDKINAGSIGGTSTQRGVSFLLCCL